MSRDQKIQGMQKKIETLKKDNVKCMKSRALDFSEKSEVENLFLDCVDEQKKELLKKKTLATSQTKFTNNIIQQNTNVDSQAIME